MGQGTNVDHFFINFGAEFITIKRIIGLYFGQSVLSNVTKLFSEPPRCPHALNECKYINYVQK